MGSKHGVLGGCHEHCPDSHLPPLTPGLKHLFPQLLECWCPTTLLSPCLQTASQSEICLTQGPVPSWGITASTDVSGRRYKGSAPDYFRTTLKGHPSARTLRGIGWSFPCAASQFSSPSTLSCSLASAAVLIARTRLHRLPTCRSHRLHPREPSFMTAGTRGGSRKQILKHDLRAGSLAVRMASLVAGERRHAGAMWLKLRHCWVRMDGVLMEGCALEGATWQVLKK